MVREVGGVPYLYVLGGEKDDFDTVFEDVQRAKINADGSLGAFEVAGDIPNGRAGSGFSEAELKRVQGLLESLARATSPFTTGEKPPKGVRFVEPQLVASVEYSDLTDIGTLRHPVYKGMRDDIDPAEVLAPEIA